MKVDKTNKIVNETETEESIDGGNNKFSEEQKIFLL